MHENVRMCVNQKVLTCVFNTLSLARSLASSHNATNPDEFFDLLKSCTCTTFDIVTGESSAVTTEYELLEVLAILPIGKDCTTAKIVSRM